MSGLFLLIRKIPVTTTPWQRMTFINRDLIILNMAVIQRKIMWLLMKTFLFLVCPNTSTSFSSSLLQRFLHSNFYSIHILERSINIQYFSRCIPNPASLKILTENLFTQGQPYRENFYKNLPLMLDMFLLIGFNLFLSIWPDYWPACAQEFELFAPPRQFMTFRWLLLAIVAANLVASLLCETIISDNLIGKISTGRGGRAII